MTILIKNKRHVNRLISLKQQLLRFQKKYSELLKLRKILNSLKKIRNFQLVDVNIMNHFMKVYIDSRILNLLIKIMINKINQLKIIKIKIMKIQLNKENKKSVKNSFNNKMNNLKVIKKKKKKTSNIINKHITFQVKMAKRLELIQIKSLTFKCIILQNHLLQIQYKVIMIITAKNNNQIMIF